MEDLFSRRSPHFDTRFQVDWKEDHVPGTQSFPFPDVISADNTYKSEEEFLKELKKRGFDTSDKEQEIVVSCKTTQSCNILTWQLLMAGFKDVKTYSGSFQEYQIDRKSVV